VKTFTRQSTRTASHLPEFGRAGHPEDRSEEAAVTTTPEGVNIEPTTVRKNGLYWKLTDDLSVTLDPDGRFHVWSLHRRYVVGWNTPSGAGTETDLLIVPDPPMPEPEPEP